MNTVEGLCSVSELEPDTYEKILSSDNKFFYTLIFKNEHGIQKTLETIFPDFFGFSRPFPKDG